jgi:hypothetical protein
MKMRYVAAAVLLLSLCAGVFVSAQESKSKNAAKGDKPAKLLRHVVLFKFKDGTTDEQLKKVTDAFAALPKKIDAIEDFEWGTNNSPEGKAAGFTHCFLVTFRDEKGRDEYLPHPAHKEFVSIVGPVLGDVLVVDYWAAD